MLSFIEKMPLMMITIYGWVGVSGGKFNFLSSIGGETAEEPSEKLWVSFCDYL